MIDISDANQFENVSAIHYQVSQATSLYNIDFIASKAMGTNQRCVFAENGSGGFMSDLTFTGGAFGICKLHYFQPQIVINNIRNVFRRRQSTVHRHAAKIFRGGHSHPSFLGLGLG